MATLKEKDFKHFRGDISEFPEELREKYVDYLRELPVDEILKYNVWNNVLKYAPEDWNDWYDIFGNILEKAIELHRFDIIMDLSKNVEPYFSFNYVAYWGVVIKDIEVIMFAIDNGADNLKDALARATYDKNTEIMNLLLTYRANPKKTG